ncbi:hypothetical protein BDZ89DRAFT_1259816, partial [Hymenopellis radicata]
SGNGYIIRTPVWNESHNGRTISLLFHKSADLSEEEDSPSNMIPAELQHVPIRLCIPPSLRADRTALETIWWQARSHDGCYASVYLLQFFFDLYTADTQLRVRTHFKGDDNDCVLSSVSNRNVLVLGLREPKLQTVSFMMPHTSYT